MVLTWIAALVFGGWFALSILNQFPARPVRIADPFSLLPLWAFFAPNPGRYDYHLVYRDYDGGGEPLTPWREVAASARRSAFGALWNPGKRASKALMDYTQSIARINSPSVSVTVPYLSLLTVVMAQDGVRDAAARRFVVVATERFGTSSPVFVLQSGMHGR